MDNTLQFTTTEKLINNNNSINIMYKELLDNIKQIKDHKQELVTDTDNIIIYNMTDDDDNLNIMKSKINIMGNIAQLKLKIDSLLTKQIALYNVTNNSDLEILSLDMHLNNTEFNNDTFPSSLIPTVNMLQCKYKPRSAKSTTKNIYIVPGSAQYGQCEERINTLIENIKLVDTNNIRYIIFSGRGVFKGETPEHSEKRKYDPAKDSYTPNIALFHGYNNSSTNTTDIQYKTEARIMHELFKQNLGDDRKYESLKNKIFEEHFAMETAANFVLAPLAVYYTKYISNSKTSTQSMSSSMSLHRPSRMSRSMASKTRSKLMPIYRPVITYRNIKRILDNFLNDDIYIVSSDYHIYRCLSLYIQMYGHIRTHGNIYALNSKVSNDNKTNSVRVLRTGDFISMYQPYEQLSLSLINKMDIKLINNENKIIKERVKYADILSRYNDLLFRLLTEHGFYNRYNLFEINTWVKKFYKYFSDYLIDNGICINPSRINNTNRTKKGGSNYIKKKLNKTKKLKRNY